MKAFKRKRNQFKFITSWPNFFLPNVQLYFLYLFCILFGCKKEIFAIKKH